MSKPQYPWGLEVRGLTKRFQNVLALHAVDFEGEAGEVHALIGANGAGKSTLMNVLSGAVLPDAGEVRLEGRQLSLRSPRDAQRVGIGMVYQENSLIPELTVAENLVLGNEPAARFGRIDRGAMITMARGVLSDAGIELDPFAAVAGLGIAQRQLVEIARALAAEPRILILDEPTAILAGPEVERLFATIRHLKGSGVLVLYVSHRLEEVYAIADRITVLRDGRKIATLRTEEVSPRQLITMMTGKDVSERLDLPTPDTATAPRLALRWGAPDRPSALSVRAGEILGLAGLVGSGRTEIALGLLGARALSKPTIEIDGRPVTIGSPRQARRMGITYMPEDRKHEGLFPPLSILVNTTAAALELLSRSGFIDGRSERQAATDVLERLHTVYRSLDRPATELSGGNQQKILFGRALLAVPRLLICDEPTSGIDVGAKQEIHRILLELAALRMGIVMISSDLRELMTTCHRLAIVRDGQVVAERRSQDLIVEDILGLASGIEPNQPSREPVLR